MPEKQTDDPKKRRTLLEELPKQEKELSKDEQKKIKGGDFIEKKPAPPRVL